MTKSVSTPGPWKFQPLLSGSENDKGFRIFTTDDGIDHDTGYVWIADVSPVIKDARGDASEEGKANARLIAAAPDLLNACKSLLEVLMLGTLEAAAKYGPDYDRDAADRDAAERATAAIVKAEGKD